MKHDGIAYRAYGNRVAIIGASAKREKLSHKAVEAFLEEGFNVFPINPSGGKVSGRVVYESLDQIESGVDLVSLYLSPERQDTHLADQLRDSGAKLVIFNPNTENEALKSRLIIYDLELREECSIVGLGRHPNQFS